MNSNPFTLLRIPIVLGLLGVAGVAPAQKKVIHDAEEPLPPEEAARTMVVPEGFQVTLFAGEPDVKQPISFCIDDRGRLWVAEAYSYPDHTDKPGKDRIIILEDTDHDGRHDVRKVFYEGLNYVSGVEVGFGGAWVMSPPFLYFIADRDGDDVPDGEPEVLLDGFGNHANAHNMANGFAWGPDGWLYGTHGRTNWSLLGKPGTPEEERIRFDGGVYRIHPVRREWEPYADGTTNPWGIDWDDYGQGFVCNCVNPHLFHVIEGAHYEPWRGRKSSQHAYERIETISDHLHYTDTSNIRAGIGSEAEDAAGGGHAHCGTMVYLGDNWPEKYRNGVFMNNIHGRRINHDVLEPKGSGYTASHAADLMKSKDPWFMGVTLAYGPDGAVFVSDWSDTGECHSYRNTRRETGRIYKISYGKPKKPDIDLAKLDAVGLAMLQNHRNDWWVRHARRILHEKAATGEDLEAAIEVLRKKFEYVDETEPQRLRSLWALHVIGGLDDKYLADQLGHVDEHVRGWVVRLLCEDGDPPREAVDEFRLIANGTEPSPVVRLQLASALQRLSDPGVAISLSGTLGGSMDETGDADDPNLPLMTWYAIERFAGSHLEPVVALLPKVSHPKIRRHIARRAVAGENGVGLVIEQFDQIEDDEGRLRVLEGILAGLEGRRSFPMPGKWSGLFEKLQESKNESVRNRSMDLALVFDHGRALEVLQTRAREKGEGGKGRNRAIGSLVAKRPDGLAPFLLELVEDPVTRRVAIRGLAEYDHPKTVEALLGGYLSFDETARRDAVQTLASRPAWAGALLDAVETKTVPRSDISAFAARQMASLGDEKLVGRVKEVWGDIRETSGDKKKLIARYKKQLGGDGLKSADLPSGRALYQRTCAACHKLFGEGGAIGPEITGAQRDNLDYLLENIIDPGAVVAKDFRVHVIVTGSGRVVTGFVVSEGERAITIQSANEQVVVPMDEIEERQEARVSMMPEGLLQWLSDDEVRDLIAYLRSPRQVPLPKGSAR